MSETPTTADEAAAVLVQYAHVPDNQTAPWTDGDPGELDTWEALTRHPYDDHPIGAKRGTLGALLARGRAVAFARDGIDPLLPLIVVMLPARYLPRGFSIMTGDPLAEVLAEDGYGGWTFRIAESSVRPMRRPRVAIVGEVDDLPPLPSTSRALALGVLACERAARALDLWHTDATTRRKARIEATAYRDHADHLTALIPASFAWLEFVEPPAIVPPIPATVPAVVRAIT